MPRAGRRGQVMHEDPGRVGRDIGAAGQRRDLLQETDVVGRDVAVLRRHDHGVLGRVTQHPTIEVAQRRIRARDGGLPRARDPHKIGTLCGRRELAHITPRPGLPQGQGLGRPVWANDVGQHLQIVQVVARVVLGIDRDLGDIALRLHLNVAGRLALRADRVTDGLRPEARELVPAGPGLRPTSGCIRRPGHAAAQAILPRRQDGIGLLGVRTVGVDQHHLRRGLRRRADVAEQLRRAVDARQDRAGRYLTREEGLLDDVRARRQRRLFGEDRRDLARVPGEVVDAPAGLGQIRQERRCALPDTDARERDALLGVHLLDQLGDAGRIGAAVGEQDDVAHRAVILRQDLGGELHAGHDVGPAADADRADLVHDRIRVVERRDRHRHRRDVVEDDHANPVLRAEQLHRADHGLLGEIELGHAARGLRHRARVIDDEQHRHARPTLLVLDLHVDRQRALERRVEVAADAERGRPADSDQAAAKIAHIGLDGVHLPLSQRTRRHIDQDHGRVLGQRRQIGRQPIGATNVDRQAGGLERGQDLGIALDAVAGRRVVDQQQARRAGHLGEGRELIVLVERVSVRRGRDLDAIRREPGLAGLERQRQVVGAAA